MNIEALNDLLREKIAFVLSRELSLENGLVTVTRVDTSPKLQKAKVYFTVIPEKMTGSTFEKIKKINYLFSQYLAKNTRLRKIPKLEWILDKQEKEALNLMELIDSLN